MTNKATTPPLTGAELDKHLDAVLRASGSALRHHTMQKTLDDMRAAMSAAMSYGAQARAQQASAAAIVILARELVVGYPALLPTLYCDGKPVGKLLLDAVTSSFDGAAAKRPEPVGMVVKATFADHKIIVPYGRLDEVEIGAKVYLAATVAAVESREVKS